MSKKLTVTGHVNLVDEASGSMLASVNLEEVFTTITGAKHSLYDFLPLNQSMGAVPLPTNNLAGIRFMAIWPIGGTITFRHDSNSAGVVINGAEIIQGVFGLPTVQTDSATDISVGYLILE